MSLPQLDETKYPCFIKTKDQNPMLVVVMHDGQRFQLPYYHFLGGQYRPKKDNKSEIYTLEFSLHIVGITGANLLFLAEAIDEMKVRLIRPAAEGTPQSEVRVTHIEVACRHGDG